MKNTDKRSERMYTRLLIEPTKRKVIENVPKFALHGCSSEFVVKGVELSSNCGNMKVKRMLPTATKVETPQIVNKFIISVHEKNIQKYVKDTLGSLHDRFVQHVLDNGDIQLREVPT